MKKVLLVDPSGDAYGKGLSDGLSKIVDLYYLTSFNGIKKDNINVHNFLKFKRRKHKILKGTNYFHCYFFVFFVCLIKRIKIIHFEWIQFLPLDILCFKLLHFFERKIVYTAHNVLPHRNGVRYLNQYKKIYGLSDKIIVHGESIKREFLSFFPEYENKICIERHGVYVGHTVEIDESLLSLQEIDVIKKTKFVFIFFGNMFYNKGVDLLVEYWLENYSNIDDLALIVIGKKDSNYKELDVLEERISQSHNIIYIPSEVDEVTLNTYISISDLILMPYRHASMSGIVFKAAELKKTFLTTNVGAILEYANEFTCFISDDNFSNFSEKLSSIIKCESKESLAKMGNQLSDYIYNNFSWDKIAIKTVREVYEDL